MKKILTKIIIAILISANFIQVSALSIAENNTFTDSVVTEEIMYLSEEEVFEALSFTFNNQELLSTIKNKNTTDSSGNIITGFDAESFSEYTNNEYGGMYLDDSGVLIICFIEDSNFLQQAEKANCPVNNSAPLKNSENETVVKNYSFKAVKHSEKELLEAYDFVNHLAATNRTIKSACIDVFENRVIVGIENIADIENIYNILAPISGKFSFEVLGENYNAQNVATISGTSAISNNRISSTPAGKMYSPRFGKYGIVTCGHGWSAGDYVYTNGTKIGRVELWHLDSYIDASFILLDDGHNYQDTHYDLFDTTIPVVGSSLTLRGFASGKITGAKVLATNASGYCDDLYCVNMIKCDKIIRNGDSGGGAISKIIDGGRTASIVAINKAVGTNYSLLIKSKVIYDDFK